MFLSFCVFAPLLTFCQHQTNSYPTGTFEEAKDKDQRVDEERRARAVIGPLPAALRAILKNAFEVPTKASSTKIYEKSGSRADARRDYMSLKLAYPKGKVFNYNGLLEDLKVYLNRSDHAEKGRPSIIIVEPNNGKEMKIVYDKLLDKGSEK